MRDYIPVMLDNQVMYAIAFPAAYLLGAVPNGLLIARARGVDIRSVGSGNIGATNVFRGVGKSWGILTFLLDFLKGFIPAMVFPLLLARNGHTPPAWSGLALGALAVIGHNWPVYLKFKGGKGVATSAGMLAGAAPAAMGIGIAAWVLLFALTRYVSVGSIGAAIAVGASAWFFYGSGPRVRPIALTALALVAVWKHRTNIRRLLDGAESRFTRKEKSS